MGGLFSSLGKSLLLVGGNVILDGTQMLVREGSIEIGSVSGSGSVELISNGNGLQLGFSDPVLRSDVVLQNNAQIFAIADGDFGSGNIAIYARNLDVKGDSLIRGGILAGLRTKAETQAGDIILNATGTVRVGEESQIANVVDTGALGNAGDIRITAGSLFLSDNAQLNTTTFGQGNGGNLLIEAADRVSLDMGADIFAEVKGTGNGGNVRISTGTLSAKNNALLEVNTFRRGNAGNVQIEAKDSISFDDAGILNIAKGTTGNAGNIFLTAGNLISLNNRAGIANQVRQGSDGAGGDIRINTGSLTLTNISAIQAITGGRGNAGNVVINARDRILVDNSAVASRVGANGAGIAGDIEVISPTITLDNKGKFIAESFSGNGGNINLQARDLLLLRRGSQISTSAGIEKKGGDGGNINIQGKSISIRLDIRNQKNLMYC